jgi:hypothetical protein
MKSARLAVDTRLTALDLDVAINGGVVENRRALAALFPPGEGVELDAAADGATFDAGVHANVVDRVANARVFARGHGVGLRTKKLRLDGNFDLGAEIESWRLDEGKLRVRAAHVSIDDAAARFGEANDELSGDAEDVKADVLVQRIALTASWDELDLAEPALLGGDYGLVVENARAPDASRFGALFDTHEGSTFAIESGRASASGEIRVSTSASTASGGMRIAFDDAGVRFNATHLAGEFAIDLGVKGLVPDPITQQRDMLDVSGSRITLHDIRAVGAKAKAASWNGDVALLAGGLSLSGTPAFDGFVQLHADDGNPILSMFLGNRFPQFVVDALKAPRVSGQAKVTVEAGRLAIRDAHLGGGDVDAVGDYVSRTGHVRAAFRVRKGALSAGVKLDDRGTWLRLFALDAWAKDEKKAVDALFAEGAPSAAERKANAKAKAAANASPAQ